MESLLTVGRLTSHIETDSFFPSYSLKKNCIGIQLIYSVLVCGVEQSELVSLHKTNIHSFQILFISYYRVPHRVPCIIHQAFISYLFCVYGYLFCIKCVCQSQSPILSFLPSPHPLVCLSLLSISVTLFLFIDKFTVLFFFVDSTQK